ncbi:uracil-DNA glycosylase family protein, partial [Streptomyces sp. S9]|nr:uracil-DNA glycosylase family protein [Streptomyces sp. S9]
ESGIPFDDASGERLRDWLGLDRDTFYDAARVAIVPMGFCYPGKGKSGDLPPRPECAPAWQAQLAPHLLGIRLTLAVGQYAQAWHLPEARSLTEAVAAWRAH